MARIYLAAISVLIVLADVLLFFFVFSEHNPWELLVAVLFGQAVSAPLLMAGIYRRKNWARFVLIAVIFLVIAIFTLAAVYIGSRQEYQNSYQIAGVLIAVGLLTIANTWLIRSKRIQHLARMGQSGCQDTGAL